MDIMARLALTIPFIALYISTVGFIEYKIKAPKIDITSAIFYQKGEDVPDSWYEIIPPEALPRKFFLVDCVLYNKSLYPITKITDSVGYSVNNNENGSVEMVNMVRLESDMKVLKDVTIVGPGIFVVFTPFQTWGQFLVENNIR